MKTLKEIYSSYNTESPVDGGDKRTIHSYIEHYYESAFVDYRFTAKRILEIGINNGHSLMMWKEYFPNAEVIGVDIKLPEVDTGCQMICGDATDPNTFLNLDNFDVIIDDGSHMFKHQIKSFEILFPKLVSGGIYIIEDIRKIDESKSSFEKLHPSCKIFDFRNLKNRSDDVIIQFIK